MTTFAGASPLRGLLPQTVAYAEEYAGSVGLEESDPSALREDLDGQLFSLYPAERAAVPRANPKRVVEFAAGRRCARRALCIKGIQPTAIGVGSSREPLWPPGMVGSITHTEGYVAAAVAERTAIEGVGIDAEPHEPLPAGVEELVSLPSERDELLRLACEDGGLHWDRILFSAKESVYKALFPMTGRWIDFDDIILDWRPSSGRFRAGVIGQELPVEGRILARPSVSGRFGVRHGYVVTTFIVPVT